MGEANVVGNKFQTAYTPIKNPSGEIIGIWYVGAPKKIVDNIASDTLRAVGVVSIFDLVIVSIVFRWFFTRLLTNHLDYLVTLSGKVANGDLTQQIKVNSKDEIGTLTGAFNKMIDNLKAMVVDVKKTSERLAAHSQDLASSSEEVSATVEEVAATTNEVAATSARGAENTEVAARESEQVRIVADEGNQAVQETVEKINSIASSAENIFGAIQKLGEQSNQIGEIISTITNIADQTNLLALNAAIEAARAGEQGRGFAVVAEEVRKLAGQSANAAEEITGVIKEIQVGVGEAINAMEHGAREVSKGVQVTGKASASLQQIIKAVEKNTAIIRDVVVGSKQVNEGAQHLTATNEQVASTFQQISSTAQELANIAAELQNVVVKFRV